LRPADPLAVPAAGWEEEATAALLDPAAVSIERAAQLVSA